MRDWIMAMWKQLTGWTAPDPWHTDPEILKARMRQQELGISQAVTRWKLEAEFWRRRLDRQLAQESTDATTR